MNPSLAVKGTYSVDAVFTSPGAYTWSLGLTLKVYDICDTSVFPNAPVVNPTAADFQIGDVDLNVLVNWT